MSILEATTSAPRLQRVPTATRNPLMLVLYYASKTNPHLVALCSRWAQATQAALGVFVVFTALMAFGAMYFTLGTLNVAGPKALWMAIAWGVFIFYLDREIVGGLDKATAIVRPLLALCIGTIVSIPTEMFIFRSRIDQDLQRQYRKDNKEQLEILDRAQASMGKQRNELTAALNDLQRQDSEWAKVMDDELVGRANSGRSQRSGPGPVYRNAQAQQAAVRQHIQEVRRDRDQLEVAESARMERRFGRDEISKTTDFPTLYEAMDRVTHDSAPLYRLSWWITITLILMEMTPALLKIMTPHVDYHHLVKAEIRENVARIDEISDRNYRLAIENPEAPKLSVSEKFTNSRWATTDVPLDQPRPAEIDVRPKARPARKLRQPVSAPTGEFNQAYLDQLCDFYLPLFGDTPRPAVSIQPANAFENANAHCKYSGKPEEPCSIEFNEEYLRSASEKAVHNTMKHELIHAWIHFTKITDTDPHGPAFVKKGREVGCDVDRFEQALAAEQKRANG